MFKPGKGMMLTAGLGTRLRPITNKFAKPAVPFLGIPLLNYPLYLMEEAGVKELVLNTHHLPEQIEALAETIRADGLKVHLSPEPGAPLGPGGGIWKARSYLEGDDFLVTNGDEVILPKDPSIISRFLEDHARHRPLATILVMRHPLVGTQFGGVWADDKGRVRGFGKDPKAWGAGTTGYHYIGLLLLNSRVFQYLPEGESNILYDALTAGIKNGESVRVVVGDFTWFETGNPKDYLHATEEAMKLLESGHGEDAACLRKILKRYAPTLSWGRQSGAFVLKTEDAKIAASAQLKGFVVLSSHASIEENAVVENSVLLPQSRVLSTITNEIVL